MNCARRGAGSVFFLSASPRPGQPAGADAGDQHIGNHRLRHPGGERAAGAVPEHVPTGRHVDLDQGYAHYQVRLRYGGPAHPRTESVQFLWGHRLFAAAGCGGYTPCANYLDNLRRERYRQTVECDHDQLSATQSRVRRSGCRSYYAEDSWKIAHNFTLDFGLRYEYTGRRSTTCRIRRFNQYNPAAFIPGRPLPEIPNDKDFGPRAGFNYALNDKTVVSGGFGLFYSHIFTNMINNIQGSSPKRLLEGPDQLLATGRGTPNWSTHSGHDFKRQPASYRWRRIRRT